MSDELTQIQIEIEKVKLQREQLALERELKQHQRVETVAQVSANTAHIAGNAVKKTGSLLMYAFIFIGSLLAAFVVMWLFAASGDAKRVGGDFGFRVGWYFIQDPWNRLIVGSVFGLICLEKYRDKKNGVVRPDTTISGIGRIAISLCIGAIGVGFGYGSWKEGIASSLTTALLFGIPVFIAWLIWPKRRKT